MKKFVFLKKSTRGQSLLEFAAGLVVLLVLLAGLIDVGRALFTYISMRDAAQEGAAFGSTYPTYCVQIRDRALNNLADPEAYIVSILIDDTPCLSATPAQACLGHTVTVTLTDPTFDITMPLIGSFLGGSTISLSATSSDTIIRTPCR
jgi:hypothetical protein